MDPYRGASGGGDGERIMRLSEPLYRAKGWIKLSAVMLILYGALTALSIVGLLVAWLPIWMGVLLWRAAKAAEQAHDASDEAALLEVQNRLRTYFVVMGVTTLIVLVVTVAQVLFMGGMMFTNWETMQGAMQQAQ